MKKITLFILLALGAVAVQAQNITGKVVDAQGKALPGASVYWADTSVGVATDLEGNYSLYRVKENNALVASFLGYTNDTIRVENKQREVNFTLTEGVAVDAVVVEGGLAHISPLEIIPHLYYPMAIGVMVVLAILFQFPKTK